MPQYEELEKARAEWIKQDEPLLKEGETPQLILRYKDSILSILEKRNSDKYYTLRRGDKFGFSELVVNQLMKFAYERGLESGHTVGYNKGRDAAMEDVAQKLGLSQ